MEGNNVNYISIEELRALDPSQIFSMTLNSGITIMINHDQGMQENQFIEERLYEQCSQCPKCYNQSNKNVVLRAKKDTKVQEEQMESKYSQPEGENTGKKEILKGPSGKSHLMDILTGNNQPEQKTKPEEYMNQENNYEQQQQDNAQNYEQPGAEDNIDQQKVPEQNEQFNNQEYENQYYDDQNQYNQAADDKNYEQPETLENPEQQKVPEQNEQFNNQGYEDQNYNTQNQYNQTTDAYQQEQSQKEIYPNQEMSNQNASEQYDYSNVDNQGHLTVPDYNVSPSQEGYQGQQEKGQGQNQIYPTFDDNDNQAYQQQEYQTNVNIPKGTTGYYQEAQQPSQEEGMAYYPQVQSDQTPIENPQQTPIQPSNLPQNQQPLQPPSQSPISQQYIPSSNQGKPFVPQNQQKRPGIQIQFGFGLPKISIGGIGKNRFPMYQPHHGFNRPHGPHHPMDYYLPGFNPHKHQFGPGGKRIVINPIGGIINAVHQVMAPLADITAKRMGLRSTKPTTSNKISKNQEMKTGGHQETVLRARRKNINNNSNYSKQGEILCPECSSKKYENKPYECKTYQNQRMGGMNNFNFHEIVETSDNSKSYVIAKKGGIIVSSDQ